MDRSVFVKIKIINLGDESRTIRRFETRFNRRYKSQVEHGYEPSNAGMNYLLERHRKGVVRPEARDSLIAYGFLRGKKYHEIENNSLWFRKEAEKQVVMKALHVIRYPNWKNIASMISRYSDKKVTAEEVEAWARSSAAEHSSHKGTVEGSIPSEPTKQKKYIDTLRGCTIYAKDRAHMPPGYVIGSASTVYAGTDIIKSPKEELAVAVS